MSRRTPTPSLGRLTLLLVTASVLLGVAAVAFDTFPLDGRTTPLGRDVEPAERAFRFATEYDDEIAVAGFVAGVAVLLARRHYSLVALFPLTMVGRAALAIPKDLIRRERPAGEWLDVPAGAAFPSGHAMTAGVVFGLWIVLAPYLVPPRCVWPVRIAAGAVIAIYGLARLWAGVHWLSDVYTGFVWSAALLSAVWAGRPPPGRSGRRTAWAPGGRRGGRFGGLDDRGVSPSGRGEGSGGRSSHSQPRMLTGALASSANLWRPGEPVIVRAPI